MTFLKPYRFETHYQSILKLWIPLLIVTFISVGKLSAQVSSSLGTSDSTQQLRQSFFSDNHQLYAGSSVTTGSVRFIGKTEDGTMHMLRLRYFNQVLRLPEYNIDLYFAASLDALGSVYYRIPETSVFQTIRGISFSPAGFRFTKNLAAGFWVHGGFYGGFSFLSEAFPNQDGQLWNFTYELDLGTKYLLTQNFYLEVNGVFFHQSNAEIAKVNPGIDMLMLMTGLTIDF